VTTPLTIPPKGKRRRGDIRRLSPEVRAELDDRILKRKFNGYRDLKIWLRQNGCMIATTSVKRYANKLEQRLGAVRLATEQARLVIDAADDDDFEVNEALLRLVQQHLFTVLVELNGVDASKANLPAFARSVSALARASILQKKYIEEMRVRIIDKVAAAQQAVETAKERGLTEAGAAQIKNVLLEITE